MDQVIAAWPARVEEQTPHQLDQAGQIQDENTAFQCPHSPVSGSAMSSVGRELSEPEVPLHEPPTCSHVPIPAATTGCLTQAYERALRNRIREDDIQPGGQWSVEKDLPLFLHDCLMLPGSLAAKLGMTAEDVLDRMTPAILPGFHSSIHPEHHKPCLMDSRVLKDHVQGMLLFGESKDTSRVCQEHYGGQTKRLKGRVELDLAIMVDGQLRLERRSMWAYLWMWRGTDTTFVPRWMCPQGWTIEGYISGTIIPNFTSSMTVSSKAKIGPDHDADVDQANEQEDGGAEEVDLVHNLPAGVSTADRGRTGVEVFAGW